MKVFLGLKDYIAIIIAMFLFTYIVLTTRRKPWNIDI